MRDDSLENQKILAEKADDVNEFKVETIEEFGSYVKNFKERLERFKAIIPSERAVQACKEFDDLSKRYSKEIDSLQADEKAEIQELLAKKLQQKADDLLVEIIYEEELDDINILKAILTGITDSNLYQKILEQSHEAIKPQLALTMLYENHFPKESLIVLQQCNPDLFNSPKYLAQNFNQIAEKFPNDHAWLGKFLKTPKQLQALRMFDPEVFGREKSFKEILEEKTDNSFRIAKILLESEDFENSVKYFNNIDSLIFDPAVREKFAVRYDQYTKKLLEKIKKIPLEKQIDICRLAIKNYGGRSGLGDKTIGQYLIRITQDFSKKSHIEFANSQLTLETLRESLIKAGQILSEIKTQNLANQMIIMGWEGISFSNSTLINQLNTDIFAPYWHALGQKELQAETQKLRPQIEVFFQDLWVAYNQNFPVSDNKTLKIYYHDGGSNIEAEKEDTSGVLNLSFNPQDNKDKIVKGQQCIDTALRIFFQFQKAFIENFLGGLITKIKIPPVKNSDTIDITENFNQQLKIYFSILNTSVPTEEGQLWEDKGVAKFITNLQEIAPGDLVGHSAQQAQAMYGDYANIRFLYIQNKELIRDKLYSAIYPPIEFIIFQKGTVPSTDIRVKGEIFLGNEIFEEQIVLRLLAPSITNPSKEDRRQYLGGIKRYLKEESVRIAQR